MFSCHATIVQLLGRGSVVLVNRPGVAGSNLEQRVFFPFSFFLLLLRTPHKSPHGFPARVPGVSTAATKTLTWEIPPATRANCIEVS